MKCSVCAYVFDIEAEGGIAGEFGILPVAFCPTCFSCMCDMVEQTDDREWEELDDDEIAQLMFKCDVIVTGPTQFNFARAIQDKLKEKNT